MADRFSSASVKGRRFEMDEFNVAGSYVVFDAPAWNGTILFFVIGAAV